MKNKDSFRTLPNLSRKPLNDYWYGIPFFSTIYMECTLSMRREKIVFKI
jgi:hypothetical protein